MAAYDGDDLRAWKTWTFNGASTYFLYDGSTPVIEENASGNVTDAAGWGADGLRMRYAPAAGFAFSYTFDPQGNLSQRLRYGSVFSTSGYDGFGYPEYFYTPNSNDASYEDAVGFGGQFGYYYDPETGLSLLTHRYYDPVNGRFLTRDPIGYEGGLNLYSLGLYNPVNNQDPSGLAPPPGPYSGPGIDWEAVGAWARRYLNAGSIRRTVNYAVRANAEDNLTPTLQTTPGVNPGASPDARISEENEEASARVSQPQVLSGVQRQRDGSGKFIPDPNRVKSPQFDPRVARRAWVKANHRPWPQDPQTGENFDVQHMKKRSQGGALYDPSNIFPIHKLKHDRYHAKQGPDPN